MDDEDETVLEERDINHILKNLSVFDRITNDEQVPEGYTAATLVLDARPESSLNWKLEFEQAECLIAKGYKICFELNLGLFRPESKPLTHQGQFQTYVLALDEFRARFLAPFSEHTEAVILYRSMEASSAMQPDYLELLRQELPDDIISLILIDATHLQDPYSFSMRFNLDRFSLFTLAICNAPLLLSCATWKQGQSLLGYIGRDIKSYKPHQDVQAGLIIPRSSVDAESIKPLLNQLIQSNKPFKVISEDLLPVEWEGLDELYIKQDLLAPTTLRTIAGFQAAGGTVLNDLNLRPGS